MKFNAPACSVRHSYVFEPCVMFFVVYLNGPNGVCRFSLLSSHNDLIDFIHALHSAVVVCCFIGHLNSCIILKLVTISVADC